MALKTKFGLVVDGAKQPVFVTGQLSFGGKQQIIIYESPGSNGGVTITTGRVSKTTTLTGKMLSSAGNSLASLREYWETVRDDAKVVTIISPIGDGPHTGQYLIEDFSGDLLEGQERYFNFTMILREFRQANLASSQFNLINFEDRENFIQQLEAVQQIGS